MNPFRRVLDASGQPALIVDERGTIVYSNVAADDLLAPDSHDGLRGVPVDSLVPPRWRDHHPDRRAAFWAAPMQRGTHGGRLLVASATTGDEVPVEVTLSPVPFAGGQAVLVTLLDVSERLAGERTQRHLAALVNATGDAIVSVDLDGRVTAWNPAAEHLYGYTEDEMLGRRTDVVDLRPAADGHPTLVDELVRAGGPAQITTARRRRDGSQMEVASTVSLLRDDLGEPIGVIDVARDVTEAQHGERELRRRSDDLARSNAALERFAWAASHDLQEPLRMVTSFTQMLARRYAGALDDDGRRMVEFTVSGAARMQSLINDLLTYARANRGDKETEPTDAAAELEVATELLRAELDASGGRVIVDTALPSVLAAPAELRQVWQNLLGNALKYRSEDPPEIHVTATEDSAGFARFHVRDNGIGIEPRHHHLVFEPFQRAAGTREGSGLGLALVRAVIESAGGSIGVHSRPGAGSDFWFTLPLTKADR
ncbi:MAG: PAS domain S-box protein [Ilumatobacteraceae bacterium]